MAPQPELQFAYIASQESQVVECNCHRLIRLLQQDGWIRVATGVSQRQFKHSAKSGRVIVPHLNKDILRETVASIYRQPCWNR